MLDMEPKNLLEEIEAAENARDDHLRRADELVEAYHGQFYKGETNSDTPSPENHAFEWLALVTPRIVFDNPVVNVSARRSGADRETMQRLQHGLNQWSTTVGLWQTLLRVWQDTAFTYGVVRTTLQKMPGYAGFQTQSGQRVMPMSPVCRRVAPNRSVGAAAVERQPFRGTCVGARGAQPGVQRRGCG